MKRVSIRQILASGLFLICLVAVGYFVLRYVPISKHEVGWFVVVAAIFGAAVNLSYPKKEQDRLGWLGWVGFLAWKVLVSVVFALALYMVFVGGFLSGDMFPHFVRTSLDDGGTYVNMREFFAAVDPASNRDVARVLVWSFLAGYSERLVPNVFAGIESNANLGGATPKNPDAEADKQPVVAAADKKLA